MGRAAVGGGLVQGLLLRGALGGGSAAVAEFLPVVGVLLVDKAVDAVAGLLHVIVEVAAVVRQVQLIVHIRDGDGLDGKVAGEDGRHADGVRQVQGGLAVGHQLGDQAGVLPKAQLGHPVHQRLKDDLLPLHPLVVVADVPDAAVGHRLVAVQELHAVAVLRAGQVYHLPVGVR